jgi:hypothetical protein
VTTKTLLTIKFRIMKTRKLILSKDNERLLIVSNRVNGTFIVRNKQQKYKVITAEDIKEVLR